MWKDFLIQILPSLVSVITSACSLLILLIKLRSNAIVEKINQSSLKIDREKITDPKGYYKDGLDSYVVVVDGKEIPLTSFNLKRKDTLK